MPIWYDTINVFIIRKKKTYYPMSTRLSRKWTHTRNNLFIEEMWKNIIIYFLSYANMRKEPPVQYTMEIGKVEDDTLSIWHMHTISTFKRYTHIHIDMIVKWLTTFWKVYSLFNKYSIRYV